MAGDIATQFAAGFASDASDLYGVCARRYSKVKAFAERFDSSGLSESAEAMLADPSIDIVYIAVPK